MIRSFRSVLNSFDVTIVAIVRLMIVSNKRPFEWAQNSQAGNNQNHSDEVKVMPLS